jgi:(S)-2-hydroxy-acid oxidase
MSAIACLQDLEDHALKVLPRNALDYYRSGADQMQTLQDNKSAFQKYVTDLKLLLVFNKNRP